MWCGMCIKYKTGECPKKKIKIPRKMSKACTKFIFNTRKVPAHVLKEAIRLSRMPKSRVLTLMALLDAGLRLKGQQLNLGLSITYDRINTRVYLISSPKRDPYAYGVTFVNAEGKNSVTSVTLDKELYYTERDKRLKAFWGKIEEKFIHINDPKLKRKKLLAIFKKMGKDYVEFMLRQNGIKLLVKGRKLQDVVDDLLKSYL